MNLNCFRDNCLLQKNSEEKENVFFLILIWIAYPTGTDGFLDSLSSYMLLPYNLHLTTTGH